MTVEHADTVDAIGVDRGTGKVFLSITDHLPWKGDHLLLLQEKLNSYLRFLESGEVYSSYPTATGRNFVIQVFLKHRPTDEGTLFLQRVSSVIESAGFELIYGPLSTGYADDDG
jgi:hypothetical protein